MERGQYPFPRYWAPIAPKGTREGSEKGRGRERFYGKLRD